jgi:hypothetical protein
MVMPVVTPKAKLRKGYSVVACLGAEAFGQLGRSHFGEAGFSLRQIAAKRCSH